MTGRLYTVGSGGVLWPGGTGGHRRDSFQILHIGGRRPGGEQRMRGRFGTSRRMVKHEEKKIDRARKMKGQDHGQKVWYFVVVVAAITPDFAGP